ncbi:hypothetical protein TSUD_422720, partial [Trifolium subterraneum]
MVSERRVDVLCIQESKLEDVEEGLVRFLWGSEVVEYSFLPSIGASGGILTIWDPRVVSVWSSQCLTNCLITRGRFIKENVEFSLANVYAPCSGVGRVRLWQELSGVLQLHGQTAWCVLGDFNAIRSSEERKSRVRRLEVLSEETHAFNQFIEANSLIDLPLCGRKFTWYSSDGRAMSRLDRFFLSDDWVLCLPNCIQTALPRTLSDHCPIVLAVDDQNWGPRPLRMMKCWSDIDGYSDFVTDKWNSMRFSGWSGYILKEKLKKIKADLRNWHLTHTSNIDSRIEGAKKRLDDLDTL